MITNIKKRRSSFMYRILSFFIMFTFVSSFITPPAIQAQSETILNLPIPGTMISPTQEFVPTLIKGMTIHPDNPLMFDFMVNVGDLKIEGAELEEESQKLIKYFLAALTIPESDMWVNLSPHEKDRIIPEQFGQTEMGRDLLAQDYMLKQLTASLMYPENEFGEKFWINIYQKAMDLYGTTEIPVNTFNKVWVVPQQAVVYEQGTSAFVISSHLKVMLEKDYVALEKELSDGSYEVGNMKRKSVEEINDLSSKVVRDILLPEIEREVNEGETFAKLRQIYNAMVLATWYKANLKKSLLGQVYVDQNKIEGIDVEDKKIAKKIYNQYMEALKKGVYNYTREDYDPASRQIIEREYFSGGMFMPRVAETTRMTQKFGDGINLSKVAQMPAPQIVRVMRDMQLAAQGNPNQVGQLRSLVQSLPIAKQREVLTQLNSLDSGMKEMRVFLVENTGASESARVAYKPRTMETQVRFQQAVVPAVSNGNNALKAFELALNTQDSVAQQRLPKVLEKTQAFVGKDAADVLVFATPKVQNAGFQVSEAEAPRVVVINPPVFNTAQDKVDFLTNVKNQVADRSDNVVVAVVTPREIGARIGNESVASQASVAQQAFSAYVPELATNTGFDVVVAPSKENVMQAVNAVMAMPMPQSLTEGKAFEFNNGELRQVANISFGSSSREQAMAASPLQEQRALTAVRAVAAQTMFEVPEILSSNNVDGAQNILRRNQIPTSTPSKIFLVQSKGSATSKQAPRLVSMLVPEGASDMATLQLVAKVEEAANAYTAQTQEQIAIAVNVVKPAQYKDIQRQGADRVVSQITEALSGVFEPTTFANMSSSDIITKADIVNVKSLLRTLGQLKITREQNSQINKGKPISIAINPSTERAWTIPTPTLTTSPNLTPAVSVTSPSMLPLFNLTGKTRAAVAGSDMNVGADVTLASLAVPTPRGSKGPQVSHLMAFVPTVQKSNDPVIVNIPADIKGMDSANVGALGSRLQSLANDLGRPLVVSTLPTAVLDMSGARAVAGKPSAGVELSFAALSQSNFNGVLDQKPATVVDTSRRGDVPVEFSLNPQTQTLSQPTTSAISPKIMESVAKLAKDARQGTLQQGVTDKVDFSKLVQPSSQIMDGTASLARMESAQVALDSYANKMTEMSLVKSLPKAQRSELKAESRRAITELSQLTKAIETKRDTVGGINLDPRLLDLQIKRDGAGVPLPISQQVIENMDIKGFVPVIINIQPIPMQNLPLLSEATEAEQEQVNS
ncbi:hypothetical protein MNBD_UNCLBAC01-1660 [hydrothermal vent metagenome]|uniref:Uncharacterized protein n=1 Tax=hydrothermal vent metagenome TaxID=652676 RepID=A0A3B1DNM6_9ZZZZ